MIHHPNPPTHLSTLDTAHELPATNHHKIGLAPQLTPDRFITSEIATTSAFKMCIAQRKTHPHSSALCICSRPSNCRELEIGLGVLQPADMRDTAISFREIWRECYISGEWLGGNKAWRIILSEIWHSATTTAWIIWE